MTPESAHCLERARIWRRLAKLSRNEAECRDAREVMRWWALRWKLAGAETNHSTQLSHRNPAR